MRFGFNPACLTHDPGDRHPETPRRIRVVRDAVRTQEGVVFVEGDPVQAAAVTRVHDPGYVDELRAFCDAGGGHWDPDTVASSETWEAALISAGLACWTARAALDGGSGPQTPFSLGRPPGHHAVIDDAMGFCFVNNVAVAAQSVIDDGTVTRVAVVDWDVHHGNGTQEIFYERGDVLYASVHQHGIYPGTGRPEETGRGDGAGKTVNVPLPAGAGGPAYRDALEEVVWPVVLEHRPDLVLVSAGFDAHHNDPLSRMGLTTEGFELLAGLVRGMAEEAGAGLGFVLEGGYHLESLAASVVAVNGVFNGDDPPVIEGACRPGERAIIDRVREAHGRGWK